MGKHINDLSPKNEEKSHFFGEWVEYRNNEEKLEAFEYLTLWKQFFIRKVSRLKYVQHQIIDRDKELLGREFSTLGIKIEMKGVKPSNVYSLDEIGLSNIISD